MTNSPNSPEVEDRSLSSSPRSYLSALVGTDSEPLDPSNSSDSSDPMTVQSVTVDGDAILVNAKPSAVLALVVATARSLSGRNSPKPTLPTS